MRNLGECKGTTWIYRGVSDSPASLLKKNHTHGQPTLVLVKSFMFASSKAVSLPEEKSKPNPAMKEKAYPFNKAARRTKKRKFTYLYKLKFQIPSLRLQFSWLKTWCSVGVRRVHLSWSLQQGKEKEKMLPISQPNKTSHTQSYLWFIISMA